MACERKLVTSAERKPRDRRSDRLAASFECAQRPAEEEERIERERGSLEALLSLPVARGSLVGGKILATCSYMWVSLAISAPGIR